MPALAALLHIPDDFWLQIVIPAAVLTAFVSVIAYIHRPRMKALVFSLPVPFTCAYLASDMPINATHLTGLILTTLYHWNFYLIYKQLGLPLWFGILTGAVLYVGGAAAVGAIPAVTDFPVLIMLGVVVVLWAIAAWLYHPIHEPGYRSTAPWYVKAPIIFPLAIAVFAFKGLLLGAVTTFPYAGLFTSYEMRHSPRTLAGQYTINNASFILMFFTLWKLDGILPKPWPLVCGWVVLVTVLMTIYRFGWGKPKEPLPAGE